MELLGLDAKDQLFVSNQFSNTRSRFGTLAQQDHKQQSANTAQHDTNSTANGKPLHSNDSSATATESTEAHTTLSSSSSSYKAYMQQHPDAKLIGINGKWYCIRNFIRFHPGGDVITQFIGKDATPLFKAFHDKNVLRHFKPVGDYEMDYSDPAARAFADLHQFFIDRGFFKTNMLWYAGKFVITACMLLLSIWLIMTGESLATHCIAGVALAAFWQQCGFFLHDFMHNELTHNRHVDSKLGLFFGTVCVGVNSKWWQEEHFVHHALTNTVDYGQGFFDPQMREELWAQNAKLFPFYRSKFEAAAIKIQHYTFIPLCTIMGRFSIVYYGFRYERRLHIWVAFILHWSLLIALLYQLPSWQRALLIYFIANVLEGILHIQLLISHYSKQFFDNSHICEQKNWYRMQIECNVNIVNPVWLDWFHGGLNFHIEHHLFPLMPRHRFREASRYIKAVCNDIGIQYDECGWCEALARTMKQLKQSATHFSLDPR